MSTAPGERAWQPYRSSGVLQAQRSVLADRPPDVGLLPLAPHNGDLLCEQVASISCYCLCCLRGAGFHARDREQRHA